MAPLQLLPIEDSLHLPQFSLNLDDHVQHRDSIVKTLNTPNQLNSHSHNNDSTYPHHLHQITDLIPTDFLLSHFTFPNLTSLFYINPPINHQTTTIPTRVEPETHFEAATVVDIKGKKTTYQLLPNWSTSHLSQPLISYPKEHHIARMEPKDPTESINTIHAANHRGRCFFVLSKKEKICWGRSYGPIVDIIKLSKSALSGHKKEKKKTKKKLRDAVNKERRLLNHSQDNNPKIDPMVEKAGQYLPPPPQ